MFQDFAEGVIRVSASNTVQTLEAPNSETILLREFMGGASQGWGREQGRRVYNELLTFIESRPGTLVFLISLRGIDRMDISFASESLVEIARRFRGSKGFAVADVPDADMLENLEAAAARVHHPLMVRQEGRMLVIGLQPSKGNAEAFQFALMHPMVRAAQFAAAAEMPIANASMKFKQLWEQGFLLRRESVADSGGVEFVYFRIG
jgi:hypothetical protein